MTEITQEIQDKEEIHWQPIETAPKDGTEVLLFEIVDVWGEDAEYPKPYIYSGKYDHYRSEKYYRTKWRCLEYDAFNRKPTHWMPLPKPPIMPLIVNYHNCAKIT